MANTTSFTPQEIEQFLQQFFDVVGARQYIGARYIPIFGRAGSATVEWDDLAPYEPLTVVMHDGVSYVSRRYVPAGIEITDSNYWAQTYRFNAQVEQYRQQVLAMQDDVNDRVPFPDANYYPRLGTLGQVLTTLADGTTKWDDPVVPSDAQAEEVITQWLDDHPEATTTVQDNSVTDAKLYSNGLISYALKMGLTVTQSNYATVLPDVNDAADNTTYVLWMDLNTTNIPAHLPITAWPAASIGVLICAYSPTGTPKYGYQLFMCASGIYVRNKISAGTFSAWTQITSLADNTVADSKLATNGLISYAIKMGRTVTQTNYGTVLPDANDAVDNTVYVLWMDPNTASIPTHLPITTWGTTSLGLLFTFYPKSGSPLYGAQLFIYGDNLYMRVKVNNTSYGSWLPTNQTNATVRVGSSRSMTNLATAIEVTGENTTFMLDAEDYDIVSMYRAQYGNDYFTNYTQGYTHLYDRGLHLKPGCKIIGKPGTRLVFDYDGSNPSVNTLFSPVDLSINNVIENVEIVGNDNRFRYHIHDDYAPYSGTNEIRNITFTGTPNQTGCIGGGMGHGNVYIIENCIFKSGKTYSMYYHNSGSAGAPNKIIVRGCYCATALPISFMWYGISTLITECIAYGNHGNVQCIPHTATPHDVENMTLYAWNNESVS